MKTALLTMLLAASFSSYAAQSKTDPIGGVSKETVVVKAANIKWMDHPSVPGGKMAVESGDPTKGASVVLLKFPKGSTVPPHWHTASETVTVVSGTATFGTGESVEAPKGVELGSGSYIVIPGKSPHWAIIKDELVISVAMDAPADFHLTVEKK